MRLVLSTRNDHKVREFADLLPGHEIDPLPDRVVLPPETGTTFADNALGKARAAAEHSGIAAEALGGAPGVYSARYAGEHATDQENLDKLLREAPDGSRVAYVCAIAFVTPEGEEHVVEGRCEGVLTHRPRGTNGFGYDPAFVPDEHPDRTMAELAPAEKAAIGHRGKAARLLLGYLDGR
jgi:XTP/dITP diphosphohydrolase